MRKMSVAIFAILLPLLSIAAPLSSIPPYMDSSTPIENRVEDAISRMTLEEKIAIVHAQSTFSSPGVSRLGIPEIWTTDGPHGIRAELQWDSFKEAGWRNDSCVAFPALSCLAATWNDDLAREYGRCVGEEARYRNKTVLLGPGVNIYRTPLNGRNFEYMGEDPYLSSRMAVSYIKGVQSNGVAACIKHYALNNNEKNRHTSNVIVDDRVLHEIYLPAFKAAVIQGGVWSLMGSYNLFNGQYCSHNDRLLNKILKQDWQFDGVVISDWGAVHDGHEAVMNGLDLEFDTHDKSMPSFGGTKYDNFFLARDYLNKIKDGTYTTNELDDKVRRILRLIFRTTMSPSRPYGAMLTKDHYDTARKIASEGIVLLKNDGTLPVRKEHIDTLLVVGENAVRLTAAGGGSSSLKAAEEISILQGICRLAEERGIVVKYARGYDSKDYGGSQCMAGYSLNDGRTPEEMKSEALRMAASADAVIFVGGLNKSKKQDCEGHDRLSYSLPYNQDELVSSLISASRKFIFANISGNAVAMPWSGGANSVIQAWYLGSMAGAAFADVLFGEVNPSGKLPFSFPLSLERCPAHLKGDYPGTRNGKYWDIRYNEGIFVGYRWYDSFDPEGVLFPFGHGLSYTNFEYGKPSLKARKSNVSISIPISNVGNYPGSEIVQVYVKDVKSSLPRPEKELKAFQKIYLQPGEKRSLEFELQTDAFSYYDSEAGAWVTEAGMFEILVGSSSRDIRGVVKYEIK